MTVEARQLGPLVRLVRYTLLGGDAGQCTFVGVDLTSRDISTGPPLGCAVQDTTTPQLPTDILRFEFIESTDADDPAGLYLRDLDDAFFEGASTIRGDTSGAVLSLSWPYVCSGVSVGTVEDRIYHPISGASGQHWQSLKRRAWDTPSAGLRTWWIDVYWWGTGAGNQAPAFINGEAVTIQ